MSLSFQLVFRPRAAAVSSATINISCVPPPAQIRTSHDPPSNESDDLRSQIFVSLAALNPELGQKAIVITNANGGYYYTCVVDREGRVKYSSLAQSCVEESLSVVLMLVWEDVVALRRGWEMEGEEEEEEEDESDESDEDENEDSDEDEQSDEEESDEEDVSDEEGEEESDEGEKMLSAEVVDEDEDMDEEESGESYEHQDDEHENIEGKDEMDLN